MRENIHCTMQPMPPAKTPSTTETAEPILLEIRDLLKSLVDEALSAKAAREKDLRIKKTLFVLKIVVYVSIIVGIFWGLSFYLQIISSVMSQIR